MKAVAKGSHGGCYAVMDACAEADKPAWVASTRLPQWLLSGTPRDAIESMRPDLLLIPSIPLNRGLSAGYKGPARHTRKNHPVYILEVGYTSDTNHEAKKHAKAQQHEALANLIRAAGWKVVYTPLEAISLGFGGTVRKDLAPLLRSLGVSGTRARDTCTKLHEQAV